jgi:hypothetical protein
MKMMRHKAFVGPTFYFNSRGLNANREGIRAQAEAFMNEVGAENIVSVAEHAMTFGPFSVVVWYQVDQGEARAAADAAIQTVGRGTVSRE